MLFSVKNKRVKSNTTTADTPGSDSEESEPGVNQDGSKSRTDQGTKKPVVAQTTDEVSEDDGGWQTCTKKKADKEKREKKESSAPVVSAVSTAQSTPRCLPGTFSTNARPDLERTKLCRRFATNQQCMFAENCWFSHDIRLLSEQEHRQQLEKDTLDSKEPHNHSVVAPNHPVVAKEERKEETIVRQKPPDESAPKQPTVAAKSTERPDPPARQLAPTVWGTLAPVSVPHRSTKTASSKAMVPPTTSTKALAPPAPTIVQVTPPTIAPPAVKEETPDPSWNEKPSPGLQFLQRERAEVSFLQQWGLPVEQGVEILAFASDKEKEMVYKHFNPSADERTIEALRRFLETCTIDDMEPEKTIYHVPPPQSPPPPPGPPIVRAPEPENATLKVTSPPSRTPAHAADDQGWEDLFLMPFSTFPSKALVPPRPHHLAPDARKVELYQERVVTRMYDGVEVSETGLSEGGYLPLDVGDIVIPTDGDYPGHSRNRFVSYFFGSLVKDGSTGWFPEAVLH